MHNNNSKYTIIINYRHQIIDFAERMKIYQVRLSNMKVNITHELSLFFFYFVLISSCTPLLLAILPIYLLR